VFSLTLPGSGFQKCRVLGFRVQRLPFSLAGAFHMQLPNWTNSQVGRLNCCWPSPAHSFLASVFTRSMTKIFVFSQTCTCFETGPPFRRGKGRSFYVAATFVAPQFQHEYPHALTTSRSLWTLWTLPAVLLLLYDVTIGSDHIKHHFRQLFYCCVLNSRCLAMAVSLAP
jgi:hypothetical protein